MPDDPIWPYPQQENVPGPGRPGHYSSDPGDTVGWLWEEPSALTVGRVILRSILGNPNTATDPWGGANVHLSLDDITYELAWTTRHRSIIGELTSQLVIGAADWQPAGTCDIDISVSPGTLISTDAAGAQAGINLCLIGDEVCSFVDAVLTGPGLYTLTGFQRAWWGTTRATWPIGTRFAILEPSQDRHEFPDTVVGQTWHYKIPSLNVGGVQQDISLLAPIHITIAGVGKAALFTNVIADEITLDNAGLHLLDTDASHDLIIVPGSNLSADRILTITTGDAARLFSILGDLYVEAESRINQDLTTDAIVTHDTVNAAAALAKGFRLPTYGAFVEVGDATMLMFNRDSGFYTYIGFDVSDGIVYYRVAGTYVAVMSATALYPYTDSAITLGVPTRYWSNGFFDLLTINATASISGANAGAATLTGALRLNNARVANADAAITGYVTIQDSTGTTYKLAIIN